MKTIFDEEGVMVTIQGVKMADHLHYVKYLGANLVVSKDEFKRFRITKNRWGPTHSIPLTAKQLLAHVSDHNTQTILVKYFKSYMDDKDFFLEMI